MNPWISSLLQRLRGLRGLSLPLAGRGPQDRAAPVNAQPVLQDSRAKNLGRLAARLAQPLIKMVSWRPNLPGGLRPWITLASLGFVLAALLANGRQLLRIGLDPQGWLWLLLGVGLSLLSVVVNGLAWSTLLRWLGQRPLAEKPVAHYMVTNLRKFLPGGIWHLAARVQALRQGTAGLAQPVGTATALAAVLLDPLLAAVAALALASLGGWQGGLGLLFLLPLGLLNPRWLQPLLARLERRKARELHLDGPSLDAPRLDGPGQPDPSCSGLVASAALGTPKLTGYPWQPLLAEAAFVLLRFAGFACCVWAFDLQLSLGWLTWLAGFALAWTVGLVVPGAPGGLGVFEAVLLLRLGGLLPAAPLLAVALSYRLMATLADLLAALLADLDSRASQAGPGIASQ